MITDQLVHNLGTEYRNKKFKTNRSMQQFCVYSICYQTSHVLIYING